MNSGHYLILLISFFGVSYAQTFSSPNLYIDNTSVLTSEVSICSQTVTIVAKLTVADSNGISSAEIPTPSLYYGNYNSTQVYEDFSQWSLETGDYYNGTYTATLTIDPSSFMAGKYGLAYGTWRTSTSSRYGYYDGALILTNECSTSIPMYHYKFEDDISNSGVGANGNGTNNYPSWSWSFTGDRFSTNKSLSLNGSMYVDLNNNLNLNTSYNQGITLSAWVYIENNTSVDSFRYIVDLTDGNSNNNWNSRVLMGLTSSSTIWLGTNHNGVLDGSQDFNVESLAVNSGEWIYVAGVWDLVNDDLTIYINGTQQNNSTDISSINSLDLSGGDSESKKIGQRVFSDSNSSGWIGKIDDVKFYNTALTSSTILNLYHANKADSVAPTVILTDTDSDNTVSNSDVVTLTATFSESMTATPTISLTGIVSDAEMTATASASIWTYTWTVSTTVTSTTATVSGTDLSGNAYAGTDSLTFTILSKSFTKTESGSFLKVLKAPNGKFLASKLSDNNASSGYNFIYESTDLQNWSQLSLSFDTSVSRGSWYGFHKDANSVLYLATKDNGVYKSSDGSSWANTISGDIGGTGAIDITSTSSYTFLLMTGNIRGIYSSNDQTNWTKIKSDGLDMADLAVGNDNTVYSITTTKRLFESQNANTTTTNVVWSENTTAAFNSKTVVVENLNDKMHLINDEGKVYRNDSGTWNNISTIPFTTTEQAYLNQLIQTSSSDFWLGTVYNGVWYSSDAGANWINYSSVYSGTYQGIFFEGEEVVITTTEGIYTHGSVSNNYNMTVYEKFDYGELEVLEGKNGGSGWDGSWINSTSSSINKHYIMSASTYSSGGGEYKIDNRSSMTYPGLSVTGNYVGDDANQTDVTKSDYRKTYKKLGSNVYIQFLVQFNNYADADNSNAKNNYFILKEGNSEKLVIKRKNGRIYMAKTTSSSASGDLVDTGVDLKGSSAAQLVIVHIGDSKTKIWIDPNLSTFNYNSPPVEDANLSYTFEFDQINLQSQAKYLYGGPTLFDEIYIYEINNNLSPTVILSDSDSDNLVSNSDVVTLTATFSESMTATPTLSLTGIVSDAEMTATASASIWTYTWTVSTTVTSTTATVSGTNLAGNAYTGTESLTFSIDNLGPTVVLSNNSLNNRVSNTQSVTLYATFSEELDITPTISLSGITTDAAMSNGNTIVLKPNNGWTSSSGSFQNFSGSSGSHPYLAEDLVIFSYLDNASIYKNFTISSGTVSIVVKLDYKKSYSEDTGQVKLSYYDANSTLLSTDESSVLTGTSNFQNLNFQSSVPTGAVLVRLELIQINESEFWAGNYGIQYTNFEITGVESGTVYNEQNTWSYTWTVSTTATSTTATVSATDNAGNSYTGSESITFVIDNERPYLVSSTLSNNLRAGYISATDTNTLTVTFNEEINASTFTTSDVTILPSGYFSITEHASTDNTIFIGYLNVLSDYAGVVTITLNENSFEDLAGNTNTVSTVSYISDNTAPTVTLTDTDSDNVVSNSSVVTITATFSESMSSTPTLSLTGIVSDAEMTATASDSIWTYVWTVSTTLTSTTASVSGTDLSGNSYNGSDILNFIMAEENLVFHYDASNLLSYNQQTTSASNNTIIDLSGNGNDGYTDDFDNVYYDSSEEAFYFKGNTKRDGSGLFIKNLNYVSGNSDQINELTLEARVKIKSEITNHENDERIILSFDRSAAFRWGIGSDQNSQSSGKLAFSFSNSEGTHDIFDSGFNSDLRDDQWHDIKINFKSNEAYGLKFYVDNQLTYSDPTVYSPIGNHIENQSPRYGVVGNGNEMETQGGSTHPDNMFYGWIQKIKYYAKSLPSVTLSSSNSTLKVSNSSVVTITANFSKSMASTPTLSLSGIIANEEMTSTASDSVWTYTWTVSGSTVTSTTATVSGTDLSGNAYAGTDSITFTIDSSNPTLVSFTDTDSDNIVNNYTNVTLTATFSEPMFASPALSISGLVTNTAMTVSSSTNSTTWTYFWDVPEGSDGVYFATVSGTDIIGNAYSGTESLTFTVDNTVPILQSVTVTDTNSKLILTYNEPVKLYDPSYFESNFTLNKSGGSATVSYTGYSFSVTDSNTIILNITVTGEPTGDELIKVGPAGASTLIDKAGNYALDYSDSSQTSNTVYLSNTPPYIKGTSVLLSNLNVLLTFSETVSTSSSTTADLVSEDFSFSITGGAARLSSPTPVSVTKLSNTLYELVLSYTSSPTGAEVLRVTPVANAIFDNKGTALVDETVIESLIPGLNAWYSVQLPDQKGPEVTATAIENQNNYVDFTFSEGVYATASPTTAVSSSSFTLSQQSGTSYAMNITSITTTSGTALSGGETIIRFNLDSGGIKPTGQEVFAITATDSSSVVDLKGNSMTVSQTNNTFQLRPPTSGGVSPEKSTIVVTPAQMIANGINTAVITVQAKDTLGQDFFEGGYQVKIFGPDGDLATTDNQNGTYSASYTPETLFLIEQENLFGFSVAQTQSPNQAVLTLYRDADGDGVYNINDQCPGTEQGLAVDEKGCALSQLDSDNDGVFDDIDQCPDTPEFEINNVLGTPTYGQELPTVVDEFGCGSSQRDTDGDGIVDMEDNCIDNANPDQVDTDEDGIGDVCDTNNPLPEVITTSIIFIQQPANGSVIGTIEAIDPDGEVLVFSQEEDDEFSGILSIDASGNITVNAGAILSYNSNYNGASLSFIVSDGENEVKSSVKIVIEDAPLPPEISIITLEISEDAEVGTIVGFVEAKDPMGGQIVSISLQGDGFIELVDGVLKTTQELDYETNTSHPITISALASDRTDGPGLIGSKSESVRVADIPNATYTGKFFLSIFNVEDETLGAKVDHRRYFNPHNKNVGKWKVKKRIAGGADADKFQIKSGASADQQRTNNPVEDENEDYLAFKTPPNFEVPGDANKDNIYEVEVEYINTNDGAPEIPIVVTQTNIQVPEGETTAIELQSQPVLPTDDSDGDGVPDVIDNSPLVANTDQTDEDGDGVGDITDDFDHDGVWNPFDTCPDSPLGELVDLNGCIIFYLPANNFSISKSEKCAGENSIGVAVIDNSVTYQVEVTGAINSSETFTTKNWSIDGLSAGVYNLCITAAGVDPNEFERCFEVTIEERDPLIVSSFYNYTDQTVSFDLSGGSTYQITQNGKTTQTSSGKYTLQLEKGVNTISISTGIECQGLFEASYLNSYEVKYTPNPFKEQLQLYFGGKDRFIELGVYASNGQLIDYQNIILPFGVRQHTLNTASYKQGVYIIKIKGETLDQSIQVIKE